MEKVIITPKTKIYDLLEAYPQLEDVLISMAPPFKKLRNPVLRKTVAKLTSISQASIIGGLKVDELVNKLRQEVGQSSAEIFSEEKHAYTTNKPSWHQSDNIVQTIDISDMLHKGEQPVHEVLTAIKKTKEGQILEIIAPFIPAPLLDKSIGLNYKHWLHKISDDEFRIYFTTK